MTECERCQDRLVELLAEELEGAELRATRDHLADCDLCQDLEARLRVGLAFGTQLPLEDAPDAVAAAIMRAAHAACGGEPVPAPPSASMLPPTVGFWGWLRAFAGRPQFVMATVMVLAVAFGAWYVPQRTDNARNGVAVGASAAPGAEAPVEVEDAALLLPDESEATLVGRGVESPEATPIGVPGPRPTEERLERGLQAYGRSDYVAAIDELHAVVSAPDVSDGSLPTAIHHLARSYQQNGDCASATRRYEQLFRRSPTYNQTHIAMLEAGSCYRQLEDDARARELLEQALQNPATAEQAQIELDLLGDAPRGNRRPVRQPTATRASSAQPRATSLPRPAPMVDVNAYHDNAY